MWKREGRIKLTFDIYISVQIAIKPICSVPMIEWVIEGELWSKRLSERKTELLSYLRNKLLMKMGSEVSKRVIRWLRLSLLKV